MDLKQAIRDLKQYGKDGKTAARILSNRTEDEWKKCETSFYNRKEAERAETIDKWISMAFDWMKTPKHEGTEFWDSIYYSIRNNLIKVPHNRMKMTKIKPSDPGIYWWQEKKKGKKYLVKVRKTCYGMQAVAIEEEPKRKLSIGYFADNLIDEITGYWSDSPIETPKGYG